MSTSRSDSLFEKWRESVEKFDYFMLGVLGALCAYVSQNYKPEKIGVNPGTLELLSLLVLVLATVFGFRRIEATNKATIVNQRTLHAHERRGVLTSVIHNGPGFNAQTGQTYTPEYAASQIPVLGKQIEQLEVQFTSAQTHALRAYHTRNALTLAGFLLLLGAKVWSAYV